MIYLTGDTHGNLDWKKLNMIRFPEQKMLTRNDYVIVLGDFGLFWHDDKTYRYLLKEWESKNYTVLWLDGNHENHVWINELPVSEWHGGNVHQTSENIIHLMRGNHYEIDGLHFFVAGGAQSYDRILRTEGVNWWKEELWSYEEQEFAFHTLQRLRNDDTQIDYVLSHTCPESLYLPMLGENPRTDPDPTAKILDGILEDIGIVGIKGWYFGHWHRDIDYGKFHCLYKNILKIGVTL